MILKPIKNEEEYNNALEEVDRLMELNPVKPSLDHL